MKLTHLIGAALLAAATFPARAGLGLAEIPATAEDGPVTVYYPTLAPDRAVQRGRLTLNLAIDAAPLRGNGRLVVMSHGTGGSPWVHADVARALVDAGFTVALPEHREDNYKDHSKPGVESWARRPAEASHAIDAVAADARFAPLLDLRRVGVYGMSAGGHTVLSLAGGRWSPAGLREHCLANLAQDFDFCVGLNLQLTGGWADGLKQWVARTVIRNKFDDANPHTHTDPRFAAAVAVVPAAADFEAASLAVPRMPLGFVTAGQDRWLVPRFHAERILDACGSCERIAALPMAGHGAGLSPLPPGYSGRLADLLNDPPGFDRSVLPSVNARVAAFFVRHLLAADAEAQPPASNSAASLSSKASSPS